MPKITKPKTTKPKTTKPKSKSKTTKPKSKPKSTDDNEKTLKKLKLESQKKYLIKLIKLNDYIETLK